MEKYIYIHDSDKFVERIPFSGLKKKKSKAFDTRSTNNVRGWKIFVRRSTDKISIPPLLVAVRKIRNRRFTGWGAGGGGKGDSRVSATHINRFARRTASKRWLTDGKEVGGKRGARVSVCKEFVPSMPQTFAINHRFQPPSMPLQPLPPPLSLRASSLRACNDTDTLAL